MDLDFPASKPAATVAQSVKAFAVQAEGWVFESLPRQTYVVITGIRKAATLEIKIYWSRFKLTELVKTEDFEHVLLKILPPQKYSLVWVVMSFQILCRLNSRKTIDLLSSGWHKFGQNTYFC